MNKLVRFDPSETEGDDAPDGTFDFIVYQLGVGIGQKLRAAFGGTQFKVPTTTNALADNHPLMVALGAVDAEELVAEIGGETIYVPHGRKPQSMRRDVVALTAAGKSNIEIATTLGISDRHVRRLRTAASAKSSYVQRPTSFRHRKSTVIEKGEAAHRHLMNGMSTEAIADLMGMRRRSVSAYITAYKHHAGLPVRKAVPLQDKLKLGREALPLLKTGLNYSQVAQILGVSPHTARSAAIFVEKHDRASPAPPERRNTRAEPS